MATVKRSSGLVAVLLIVSVFFTACEIPDISKFTEQSAEMTRGIRKGIKDTGGVLKAASERDDLYSPKTIGELKANLKDYQASVKSTGEALDALDAYLEALNALAQANKKSGENAGAAVDAMANLVTAVSGLTFASSAVNVAKGLGALLEEFRTAKDFKKRVNLAAVIVEGVHPRMGENGKQLKDEKGRPIFERRCTGDAEAHITQRGEELKKLVAPVMANLSEDDNKLLKPLTSAQRRAKLREMRKFNAGQLAQIDQAEAEIARYGCGVIDLIKFNVRDIQRIHDIVAPTMLTDVTESNRTVLGYYKSIVVNDRVIQRELRLILNYKSQVSLIGEAEETGEKPDVITDHKIKLREHLTGLFVMDGPLRLGVLKQIEGCGAACGRMRDYLTFNLATGSEGDLLAIINGINRDQFDRSNGLIGRVLEVRAEALQEQNARYLDDLERLTPSHAAAVSAINSLRTQQNQLDALLDASLSALDAWAETHANLRVAVNTKKPLTAAKLASKVREIWTTVNPEAE